MTHRKTIIACCFILLVLTVTDWQLNVPLYSYLILALCYISIAAWGAIFISSQFFLNTKCKGHKMQNSVAITFDDGPVAEKTSRILDILEQAEVKATFFCIGKNVSALPHIVKEIKLRGHLIGNHSYFHGTLFDLQSSEKMTKELSDTNNVIQNVTGMIPRFFRPPYGVTNPMLARAVKNIGYVTIGWSIRSFDTVVNENKKLFLNVTKNLKAGDVILFHDRCEATIEILPDLLEYIKKAGLKVEPLDKLLQEKAYV